MNKKNSRNFELLFQAQMLNLHTLRSNVYCALGKFFPRDKMSLIILGNEHE